MIQLLWFEFAFLFLFMLLGLKPDEVDQWKESLHTYEKGKRTKKPFGKNYLP